jgi:hypothetical protein
LPSDKARIAFVCPSCYRWAERRLSELPVEHACLRCGRRQALAAEGRLTDEGAVKMCLACGCGHLYLEKDFNATVGCLVILAAAALFLIFSTYQAALLFLLGAALMDFLVYLWVGKRAICYRCLAEYRGFPLHPEHGPYELGIASRFADDAGKGEKPRDQA